MVHLSLFLFLQNYCDYLLFPRKVNSFFHKLIPIEKGVKKENNRVASPESDPTYAKSVSE